MRRSCAWLATPDGRDYIRFVFQFVIRLPLREHLLEGTEAPSLASVRAQADLIHEALPDLPERIVRERAVASLDLVLLQVAERARIIDDEDGRGLLPKTSGWPTWSTWPPGCSPRRRRASRSSASTGLADRPARLVGLGWPAAPAGSGRAARRAARGRRADQSSSATA